MLIWSPHRDPAGPLRLYRAFGDQLKLRGSPLIFSTIEDMARSIIRDKISNMTIHDVLKNRSALRDAIRTDIQAVMTGWGMWLETIEISDVQICSSTLFRNLQSEYKEDNRLKAYQITSDTQDKIKRAELDSDINYLVESTKAKVTID